MPDNLITLEIQFAASVADDSARLFWVDGPNEQGYGSVQLRATIRQETFPGHKWILKGEQSGNVIWECIAAAQPAVQVHTVRARPPVAAEADGEGAPAAAAAADGAPVAAAAADGEAEQTEETAGADGRWQDATGLHIFERLSTPGRHGETLWRQVDSSGRQTAGQLEQLEARVDTRWLWWTRAILSRVAPQITGEREHMLWCAVTIAAAYRLDYSIAWPAAIREAAARVGPQPMALLCALFLLVMCTVAAAVPLRDTSLVLYHPTERTEVRLADTHGYTRQPSNRPGYTNPWTVVAPGTFVTLPPDLKAMREKRGFHAAFVLGAAAAIVSAVMKGLRVAAPPPSPAELLEDYLLSAAAEGA